MTIAWSFTASASTARADSLGNLRFAARVAGLIAALILFLPLHGLWRLFRARSPWPSRFLGTCARICGVRARVVGRPVKRDVFNISNHSSWLDILILGGATRSAFVSKAELKSAPLVGFLAGLNRTVYIDRSDRRAMHAQIAEIREAIHDGPVTIFCEGTTSDGTVLLPFKAPLLQVLEPPMPGMRVQPLFLDYGAAAPEIAWGQENGAQNARRLLSRKGTVVCTVHCLEPFDPAAVGGRKAVSAEARRRIVAAIQLIGSRVKVT